MLIPLMLEINGLGRLVSILPLSVRCIGRIDSVVSDSRYGSFAFFDLSRFGFVFDGFVFKFVEWIIFRAGISWNFIFCGSLLKCEIGSMGWTF